MNGIDKNTILIVAGSGITIVAIIVAILIKNKHKKNIKKEIDQLYVRFNEIKTVPLAFKLNKAQAMAKRSEETTNQVNDYYNQYEELEKHIDDIQNMINDCEDEVSSLSYKEAKKSIKAVSDNINDCETEVKKIDEFLEEFSKKEDKQREYSSDLKEKYHIVKNTINENSNVLSIAYDGFLAKLQECEELFSSSEEWMYASDYIQAQNDLEKIDEILENIKVNANAAPRLIKDTKGVLPLMLDETKREYALTKQRGVNIDYLDVDNKIATVEKVLSESIKQIMKGETEGLKKEIGLAKDDLNDLKDALAAENRSYKEAKEACDKALEHIQDLEKVENYVSVAYEKDSARFGLENLKTVLKKQRDRIAKYKTKCDQIIEDLNTSTKAASKILTEVEELVNDIDVDKKELYSYKANIDKSTDGEVRANSQLIKLQLVVAEVETKVAECNLPSISPNYKEDLLKARQHIDIVRNLTKEIPIDIEKLNLCLDEAIDFIYKFYNNVNNIVGMAIMVENAIVFGNKYRSSYASVDRELSKAEFQYLNGEYTKALKTAITCMETLFPDNADEKIMENA